MTDQRDIPSHRWYKENPEYTEEIEISDSELDRRFDEYYEDYQERRENV